MSDQPTVTFSGEAALPDFSAFQSHSYLARVDWPTFSVVVKLPPNAAREEEEFWHDSVLAAAKAAFVEERKDAEVTEWPKPVLWRDSLGRPVDVENIDKVYALNILMRHVAQKTRLGYSKDWFKRDELTQKLRETVLNGREPGEDDKARAIEYNRLNKEAGLPHRAPVESDDDDPVGDLEGPRRLFDDDIIQRLMRPGKR